MNIDKSYEKWFPLSWLKNLVFIVVIIDKIEGNDNTEMETINQRSVLPGKLT